MQTFRFVVAYDVSDPQRRESLRQILLSGFRATKLSDSVYATNLGGTAAMISTRLQQYLRPGDALHVIPVGGLVSSYAPPSLLALAAQSLATNRRLPRRI